jgi:hypothetical protein
LKCHDLGVATLGAYPLSRDVTPVLDQEEICMAPSALGAPGSTFMVQS